MDRLGNEKLGNQNIVIPVAASTKINEGTMVAINSSGYAIEASKAANLVVAGCAMRFADNSNGAAGDVEVQVRRGTFVWANDGTIEKTDILKKCYVSDTTTVTITSTESSAVGTILAVDSDGVTVDMQ